MLNHVGMKNALNRLHVNYSAYNDCTQVRYRMKYAALFTGPEAGLNVEEDASKDNAQTCECRCCQIKNAYWLLRPVYSSFKSVG